MTPHGLLAWVRLRTGAPSTPPLFRADPAALPLLPAEVGRPLTSSNASELPSPQMSGPVELAGAPAAAAQPAAGGSDASPFAQAAAGAGGPSPFEAAADASPFGGAGASPFAAAPARQPSASSPFAAAAAMARQPSTAASPSPFAAAAALPRQDSTAPQSPPNGAAGAARQASTAAPAAQPAGGAGFETDVDSVLASFTRMEQVQRQLSKSISGKSSANPSRTASGLSPSALPQRGPSRSGSGKERGAAL